MWGLSVGGDAGAGSVHGCNVYVHVSLNTSVAYRPVVLSTWYADLSRLQEIIVWTPLVDPQNRGFNVDTAVPRIPMLPTVGERVRGIHCLAASIEGRTLDLGLCMHSLESALMH